jgi:MFS family permease
MGRNIVAAMFASILRTPGVAAVYLASILGRLPNGALGLVLLLRTREMTGSYAAGGVVAAASAIAVGVSGPALGRIIDRRGQGLVLCWCGVAFALATFGFAALPDGAPLGAAIALAALGGLAVPPLSACQRALWSDALAQRLRHGAYALDSVVFELVYIAGPLLLVSAVGAWSLRAAIVAAGVAGGLGTIAFAATRLSREWRPHATPSLDPLGPLRGSGVRTVLCALALFAVGIAAVEVAVAAFATSAGHEHAVGVLLALWGVGSMLGGLVFGHLPEPEDPAGLLAAMLLALALLEIPLVLAGDLVTMGIAITVAGAAISPGLSLAFRLLSEVAPPGTRTEAQTWVQTGFGGGMALGSAFGGWLVEHAGTTEALSVVVVVGLLAALVVFARVDTLRAAPVAAC